MVTLSIKLFFSLVTLYIFLYCCSYINYEIKNKSNILGSITFFIFVVASIAFSNIIFWLN